MTLVGFRLDSREYGYVRVTIFAGKMLGSRGNCGQLTFREEEWDRVERMFVTGGMDVISSLVEVEEAHGD